MGSPKEGSQRPRCTPLARMTGRLSTIRSRRSALSVDAWGEDENFTDQIRAVSEKQTHREWLVGELCTKPLAGPAVGNLIAAGETGVTLCHFVSLQLFVIVVSRVGWKNTCAQFVVRSKRKCFSAKLKLLRTSKL